MVTKTSGLEEDVRTRITPYDCCSGVEVNETESAGAGTAWIDPDLVDEIPGAEREPINLGLIDILRAC